ncbi:Uma2 family endonuclease [Longimonas halophila]|uniref:Uma2 family endonuclease n=1 Tax=Longimonas halophila TaxID=1469170 RepID=UPI001FE8E98B|nr:Uma2 family endonuclease [Longimonas halophila]
MTTRVDSPRTTMRPYRFTYEEVLRIAEADMLRKHENVELIDGQLIPMSPVGDPHVSCVNHLTRLLVERTTSNVMVSVQNPLRIDAHNAPEPDVVVTTQHDGAPTPATTLLVVEVSDTTLTYDRDVKLPLYAEAEIPEVWIVNLEARQVEVYRDPSGPDYTVRLLRDAPATVDVAALPDIAPMAVSSMLPPEDAANASPERTIDSDST